MKIRPFLATVGAMTAVILVATPVSAFAPCYNYGTRDVPGGAVAGGARYGIVTRYAPAGQSIKGYVPACSTGVPWSLKNGVRGFLTAGHCLPSKGPGGAQIIRGVKQSSWTPGAPLGTRGAGMTTYKERQGTMPGKVGDIAFVPSKLPVQNYVFTGGPGSKSLTRITSWTSKATSTYTLCFSGYGSGSHCGLKQGKKTSFGDSDTGDKITGVAEAYYGWGRPGQTCGDDGDSGGVVYRMSPDGRSAYVVGILSGSSGGRAASFGCSMFYTPLGAAVKQFGGGPIIS